MTEYRVNVNKNNDNAMGSMAKVATLLYTGFSCNILPEGWNVFHCNIACVYETGERHIIDNVGFSHQSGLEFDKQCRRKCIRVYPYTSTKSTCTVIGFLTSIHVGGDSPTHKNSI